MSAVTRFRPGRPAESEYYTDWRVAWAIGGLILLAVAIPASSRFRPSIAGDTAPVVALRAEVPTRAPAKGSRQIEDGEELLAVSVTPLTPWMTHPEPAVRRSRNPERKANEKIAKVKGPAASSAQQQSLSDVVQDELVATEVRDEIELERHLSGNVTEVAFQDEQNSRKEIIRQLLRDDQSDFSDGSYWEMIAARTDLAGLPFLKGTLCRKAAPRVRLMSDISGKLRRLAVTVPARSLSYNGYDNDTYASACARAIREEPAWHQEEAVSTLAQMLQAGSIPLRLELVNTLATIPGTEASSALVDRALFDLSPTVRNVATMALRNRPADDELRRRLLFGLRYPWSPVADHAAAAISKLQKREWLPDLVRLLDEPDPSAPFVDQDGQWRKTELVRVNHLANCLLCHAVSTSQLDSPRGVIPIPGRPLPQAYYDSLSGNSVRADVTYLRQDFSVMLDVPDSKAWPKLQRFDYLTRTRPLTPYELGKLESQKTTDQPQSLSFPQRDAIARAIQRLNERQ